MHVDAYHLCSQNIILLYWYFLHNHNSLTPFSFPFTKIFEGKVCIYLGSTLGQAAFPKINTCRFDEGGDGKNEIGLLS